CQVYDSSDKMLF
nr:immunoglobulin light chain junction region [Macaca mulatta]